MYNLFYVESPLQMLSAISALKKFGQHKSVLIVTLSYGNWANNDAQILNLIDDKWGDVFIQKKRKGRIKTILGRMSDLIKYGVKYKGQVDKYFFGEYRNLNMAMLCNILCPKESILLDDGAFTIIAQNQYIKKNISFHSKSFQFRALNLFYGKLSIPNLYSFFQLDSSLVSGQVNYFEFPEKKDTSIKEGCAYLFGTKFFESKNMLLTDELKVLSEIIRVYNTYEIFYIPHRDETRGKLSMVSKLGYQIKYLNKPAEVFFDETEAMPELVLSCYSTILYTCYIRFANVKVQSIDIGRFLLKESTKTNAKLVYEYYKALGISVVEF